jgi:hypothetical protein
MFKNPLLYLAVVGLTLGGCASTPPPGKAPAPTAVIHEYHIKVTDIEGVPLNDATITFTVKDNLVYSDWGNARSVTTSSGGQARIDAMPAIKGSWDNAYSAIQGTVSRPGYLDTKLYESVLDNAKPLSRIKRSFLELTLLQPQDYINTELLVQLSGPSRTSLLDTLVDIRAVGEHQQAAFDLKPRSINLVDFKGKRYLRIPLQGRATYNIPQLSQYQIGAVIFDNGIRQLLTALDQTSRSSLQSSGFNLSYLVDVEDYSNPTAIRTKKRYDFYLDREEVTRYKQQDISRQVLLNRSIVLIDGERVDIRLM